MLSKVLFLKVLQRIAFLEALFLALNYRITATCALGYQLKFHITAFKAFILNSVAV
jgi:hypothetical protein